MSGLPNYTYVEAREMIERTTGETTRYNKGDFPKGQEGMYYIYTDTSVYIVNAETRNYVKGCMNKMICYKRKKSHEISTYGFMRLLYL